MLHPTDLQSMDPLREELEGCRTPHPDTPWYNGLRCPHRLGPLPARTWPNDIPRHHHGDCAGNVRSTLRDERYDYCPHRDSDQGNIFLWYRPSDDGHDLQADVLGCHRVVCDLSCFLVVGYRAVLPEDQRVVIDYGFYDPRYLSQHDLP